MAAEISATEIANRLSEEIHAGAFETGEMLPGERDLCERFGVGRNVVREAHSILNGRGLTTQEKGKRPRVASLSLARVMQGVGEAAQFFFSGAEGMAHLEQARLFLETSLLRYAVVHATNAQIAKMLEAIEDCDASLHDIEAFREADVRFHRALAEVPGNPIFIALHDTFVEKLMRNRAVLPGFRENARTSNAEHRAIVAAILDKDADKGVEVLTRHLVRNYGTYFRLALEQGAEAGARLETMIQNNPGGERHE